MLAKCLCNCLRHPQAVGYSTLRGLLIWTHRRCAVLCDQWVCDPIESCGTERRNDNTRTKSIFIRRFFRLYPAYWVSVLASGLLALYMLSPFSRQTLLLNLTMLQGLLGVPDVMGLYWTLRIELLFYGACVVLFSLRLLHQPRWLVVGLLASLLSGAAVVAYRLLPASASDWLDYRPVYGLYLAIMFWGALFRRWHDQQWSDGTNSFTRPKTSGTLTGNASAGHLTLCKYRW